MRTGLFSNCDPSGGALSAAAGFAESAELIQHAESLGFDEAWVGEQPLNQGEAAPAHFSMLSQLAARTTRIRLGSLALASPWRNPIAVANDVARLDLLCGGRLDFAFGKSRSFPVQRKLCKHSGALPAATGARTLESLTFVQRLLSEERVTFAGQFHNADRVRLEQRPIQTPIPTYVASSELNFLRFAAQHECGVIAEPLFALNDLAEVMRLFRELSPGQGGGLVAMRFFHIGATHDQAVEEAAHMLAPRFERALAKAAPAQQVWMPWFQLGRLIADSLIGTVEDIRAKIYDIERRVAPTSVILAPVSRDFAKRKADLALFAREIRPAMEVAA
ncbi:LLM class flavin-dependent oxidoreductase [Methylocapsa polymorpha]|uniref:LLM class flavin-dependent oxidoreductase n=1 Tax=Methylocapsa polymorpha TaxID=3080828 RepID=A0ABZ0HSD9_9HYPH|nr:LLM class flavin-dependent oxidoreductase [Methylocapsa sp. RX1]